MKPGDYDAVYSDGVMEEYHESLRQEKEASGYTACGRVAFESYRDDVEPDGWCKGLSWDQLHPDTQQVWIDHAKRIIREWDAEALD